MRIISWNVRFDNRNAMDLIKLAMNLNPDILCLQEIPGKLIPIVRKEFPHSHVYGCLEVSHSDPDKQHFLCTITKTPADIVKVVNYEQQASASIWEKFYFRKLHKWTERHAALVITLPVKIGQFRIVNLHLSSNQSPLERVSEFKFVMNTLHNASLPTVYCGDFNIVDNNFYRYGLGWLLGFTAADYKTNERRIFDTLFIQFGLVNIFNRMSTYIFPWHGLQLDHILIPEHIQVIKKVIGKKRYASDHRMILADLTQSYYGL